MSRHFNRLGHKIIANDNLYFCCILAKATLLINDEPTFFKLMNSEEIPKQKIGKFSPKPYDFVLYYLNHLPEIKGFIFNEYSPGGTSTKQCVRRYFIDSNAKKIDAIREKIKDWGSKGLLSEGEEALLIADLMRATNKVANIAGTYGYFLKEWDPRTKNELTLRRSQIIKSNKEHEVYNEDANQLVENINCEVLYLDPPYTWRHYGAYYHILETIARWDKPEVSGMAGLRPWENSRSRYCHREEAADALMELIQKAKADHIFLSYNDEGLIPHEKICEILSTRGEVVSLAMPYRRYRSHNNDEIKNKVLERIYYVKTK